jgi:bidirectional [NiFe] hydrogenase diaphorase subunit
MIVMDDTACMVDVARYFMDFCREESCGKCIPCRVGTTQLHTLLTAICEGDASMEDLERLERLSDMVKHTSLCGLGQSAPNPVFSTLRYFREEYLAHVQDRTCPAGVCPVANRPEGSGEPHDGPAGSRSDPSPAAGAGEPQGGAPVDREKVPG